MEQLSFFRQTSWTVTELTRYLRKLLESDDELHDLWVRGEISNLSRPTSGHVYFTLKDEAASLRCVMWRSTASRLDIRLGEGDAIEAHGNISVYEPNGLYQLYVDAVRPAGEGVLYQEFLRLKARLEAEGLFADERKKSIPPFPRKIGIVTSPTGAALRDMLNTLRRRYPLAEVILAPTPVQGDEAPPSIVSALGDINLYVSPDVILLARGGGTIEDLWAFNDERVARAIFASQAPVITGVGHETDFTIADFVADLRAPTPTAAAELATPDKDELQAAIGEFRRRMARSLSGQLNTNRLELNGLNQQLRLYSPLARIRSDRQRLDELVRRVEAALAHRLKFQRAQLGGHNQRLSALNPLGILERGYAMVSHPDGRLVRSVTQVQKGDDLNVRVSDGTFEVRVHQERD